MGTVFHNPADSITNQLRFIVMKINPPNIAINAQTHVQPPASKAGYWTVNNDNESTSTVQISQQGRELSQQASKTNDFGYALKQPKDLVNESEATEEGTEKGDLLDEKIKQVREQIRELQQEILKLKNQNTEAAKEQIKALTNQMMALSAQLIALNEEKLKKMKNEA